jgi:hypothetical protein
MEARFKRDAQANSKTEKFSSQDHKFMITTHRKHLSLHAESNFPLFVAFAHSQLRELTSGDESEKGNLVKCFWLTVQVRVLGVSVFIIVTGGVEWKVKKKIRRTVEPA